MSHATKNFSDANLVGAGSFGKVYMACCSTAPSSPSSAAKARRALGDSADEGAKTIRDLHRNVVTPIGYCQEGGLQMLVFEHQQWQRLQPPVWSRPFAQYDASIDPQVLKTSNALVDENFIAKVSDAGVDRAMEVHFTSGELVDPRLGGSFTSEGMKELVALTLSVPELIGGEKAAQDAAGRRGA
ncbi:hypothetical protein QYE76_017341 [Lolium multiflorum]|uniref:non-specific serine/threonine protein kinase n=1 Tax=Lolium multiflorum TaxID=4521 RepID=A0AAD8PIY1_LOLMU|nr:hypothetical protein QYE76_017341 [Lolium multiflorum]